MTQLLNTTTGAIANFSSDSVSYWLTRGWALLTDAYVNLNPQPGDVLTFVPGQGWQPKTPPATTVSHLGRVVPVGSQAAMLGVAASPDVTIAVLPEQMFLLPGGADPTVLGNWIAAPFASADDVAQATADLEALAGDVVHASGGGGERVVIDTSVTGQYAVDVADGNVHRYTLAGNATLNLPSNLPNDAADPRAVTLMIHLKQPTVSPGKTVAWSNNVDWGFQGAPVLSQQSGQVDIVSLHTVNGGGRWYGVAAGYGFGA